MKDSTIHRVLKYSTVFVVFLTFISREVLREHWRDLVDAIERTQSIIDVRLDIDSLAKDISRVSHTDELIYMQVMAQRMEVLERRMPKKFKKLLEQTKVNEDGDDSLTDRILTGLLSVKTKLKSVEPVLKSLPDSRIRQAHLTAVDERRMQIAKGCFDAAVQDLPNCSSQVEDLQQKADAFYNSVLDEASKQRDRYSLFADLSGWAGVCLFSIGLVLSFIAGKDIGPG